MGFDLNSPLPQILKQGENQIKDKDVIVIDSGSEDSGGDVQEIQQGMLGFDTCLSEMRRHTAEEDKGKRKIDRDRDHDQNGWLELRLGQGRCVSELGFQFVVNFLEEETENNQSVRGKEDDVRRMERDPNGSPSKRRRYSAQEKGKASIDDDQLVIAIDGYARRNQIRIHSVGEKPEKRNPIHVWLPAQVEPELLYTGPTVRHNSIEGLGLIREHHQMRTRHHELAREHASRFAHFDPQEEFSVKSSSKKEKKKVLLKVVDKESQDSGSPFCIAMEMIKKRNSKSSVGARGEFKWGPAKDKEYNVLKRSAPSLLDLSLKVLAKNAEKIVSLELVPDPLRHRLSQLVSDNRKMDAGFVELLARGSPTELRVKDCSKLNIQDFTKILGACNIRNLTVLQLDLCGQSMSDYLVRNTFARSFQSLPALATISLKGATCLTDIGLTALAASAPALQSVNLSDCLLSSTSIVALVSRLESTLRELYIDHCDIDAMVVLPALTKLKCLEVLSVAGLKTVCDDFVIEMVQACGMNLKELVLRDCVELTDMALKSVGKTCSRLYAIDLCLLPKLTDSTMQYLANGCRSIHSLKLCRNIFSDEAIAAFLEASGNSLSELSLNGISKVGLNTALSLAKCSRNLLSLDLSWCRRLTNEELGLIVDSCTSLRLLKIFGCTQITDEFLNGHSNSMVKIIGLKKTPLLEHLNVLEPQRGPLRYSPVG